MDGVYQMMRVVVDSRRTGELGYHQMGFNVPVVVEGRTEATQGKRQRGYGDHPIRLVTGVHVLLPSGGVCAVIREPVGMDAGIPRAATTALTANGERYRRRGVYRETMV